MIGNFPALLKLNRFICNYLPVLPNHWSNSLNGENRQLVTDEPVEFEK